MRKICDKWSMWGRRVLWISIVLGLSNGTLLAQTVSFNFTATSQTWPGWVNVTGDPSVAVRATTANGITVSSVATANWVPWSGIAAQNSGGSSGSFFPSRIMNGDWFTYNGTGRSLSLFNSLVPQLKLSGLNPDSTYILVMSSSDAGSFVTNPTVYTVIGATNYGSKNLNIHNNLSNGVVFSGIAPDSTGAIRIYVNATSSSDLASICGLQIYPGYYGVGGPSVIIGAPKNGATFAEGNNVVIQASAQEARSQISKVEFFADTTKIGEVDTVPYVLTWRDVDPGVYTFTVRATDSAGAVNSSSVSSNVQDLNYFWSTTGNAGNKADSTFLGTVDSVRLDFRTKDIQRMSIAATGNIGIGTLSPTANLHVAGSVRLAGLVNDSTSKYPRALVTDSSGSLAYRPVGDIGLPIGGGLGLSSTGLLSLGDSTAVSGAHSFIDNRYQNLTGYFYSIGGSLHNPIPMPNFRWYDNGDFVTGATMDTIVATVDTPGVRYYSKLGILEIGASDYLDTARNPHIYGNYSGSGIHLNSSLATTGDPKMINTLFLGAGATIDTSVLLINSLLVVQGIEITGAGALRNSLHVGGFAVLTAPVNNSIIGGYEGIDVLTNASLVIGSNVQGDTTQYSTITGFENVFGALGQVTGGAGNKSFTPFGSTFGLNNVAFSSLSHTGTRGVTASGISGYPLLALGNSAIYADSQSSNALTILYNGRTQINTTGYGVGLTQTAATPKAALEVVSKNSGVLLPKLNTSQQNGVTTQDLQSGLLLYNIDSSAFQFYNGARWSSLGGLSGRIVYGWGYLGNPDSGFSGTFIGTTDTAQLAFRTNNVIQMTLFTNGGLGIGTVSSPASDAALAVDGSIYASKIFVTLTGWPDYVFKFNYKLPSLNNVERSIGRHKHLPGLPNAAEIKARGLDLGEMQKKLLQKIEELTLYLIDIDKNASAQERDINELRASDIQIQKQQVDLDQMELKLAKMLKQSHKS